MACFTQDLGSGECRGQAGTVPRSNSDALCFAFGTSGAADAWAINQDMSDSLARAPWDSSYGGAQGGHEEHETRALVPGAFPVGSSWIAVEAAGQLDDNTAAGLDSSSLGRMQWDDASSSWLPEAGISSSSRHVQSTRSLRRLQWDYTSGQGSDEGEGMVPARKGLLWRQELGEMHFACTPMSRAKESMDVHYLFLRC